MSLDSKLFSWLKPKSETHLDFVPKRPGVNRLLILDPSYRDDVGHYAEYDEGLARAALDCSVPVLIAGHIDSGTYRRGMREVFPVYEQDIWFRLPGADFMSNASLNWAADKIEEQTLKFLVSVGQSPGDIVLAPNVTPPQLIALARLIERGVTEQLVELLIRYQVEMFAGRECANAWRIIRRAVSRARARVVTDSDRLATDLQRVGIYGAPVVAVPSGGHLSSASSEKRERNAFRVVTLGAPRAEKGFLDVLEAAGMMESLDPTIEFHLQANHPSPDVADAIQRLKVRRPANVHLIEEPMSQQTYSTFIRSADAVLLPYSESVYRARTSSALVESVAAGVPVVVSRHTWLAEFAEAYRVGLTCGSGEPMELAHAILRARRSHANLLARARVAAPAVSARYSASALYNQLAAIRDQALEQARDTILVVYPWAAEDIWRSGSGARLNALVRRIESRGMRSDVLCFGQSGGAIGEHSLVTTLETGFIELNNELAEIEGLQALTADRRMHLRVHVLGSTNQPLQAEIRAAAEGCLGVIVEHTHLAAATHVALEGMGIPVAVVANDFLREPGLDLHEDPLVEAQLKALSCATSAFAVSPRDVDSFAGLRVPVELSKNPAGARLSPPPCSKLQDEVLAAWLPDNPPSGFFMFVGTEYWPNKLAAENLRKVAALLQSRHGANAPLVVVLGGASPQIRGAGFAGLGVVPTLVLDVLYARCTGVVIPLLEGGGTSVKTVEAVDRGCLVLTTKAGSRGLDDLANHIREVDCSREDVVARFADAIDAICAQPSDRTKGGEFAGDYAQDGLDRVVDSIAPRSSVAVDQELSSKGAEEVTLREFLTYSIENASEAALEQALSGAFDGVATQDTRLMALEALYASKRLIPSFASASAAMGDLPLSALQDSLNVAVDVGLDTIDLALKDRARALGLPHLIQGLRA